MHDFENDNWRVRGRVEQDLISKEEIDEVTVTHPRGFDEACLATLGHVNGVD